MSNQQRLLAFWGAGMGTAVLLFAFFFALFRPAQAMTCNVSGSGSIQSAIDNVSCDTIIVAAGTFMENLDIGRSVTIQGAGASSTIVNGGGNGRVVTIDGNITVALENLRLTNGDATSESTRSREGGGILVTGGATLYGNYLQLDNNIASSSTSGFGGGISINTGSATISNTVVSQNFANKRSGTLTGSGKGGGIFVNGPTGNSYLSLYNSQILSNTAAYRAANTSSTQTAAGGGLAVNENATANLNGNLWQGNVARGSNSGNCSICTTTDPSGDGGAIAVLVTTQEARLMVNGDRFLNNVANASPDDYGSNERAAGGAISLMATNTAGRITGTITSAYMSGNAAKVGATNTGEGWGGALHARGATLIVRQSTILNNISDARGAEGFGGGVYVREPNTGDYLEVMGSVIAGNTAANSTSAGAQIHVNYTTDNSNRATILHSTLADDAQSQNTALFYNGPTAGDELFIGNTIFANHVNGIHNVNVTGWARARHLLFYNVTNEQAAGSTGFPGSPSDTTTWITGNPLFVDAANGDYHIQPGSAAQDAGNGEAGYYYSPDVDGDARPQGADYDIGADELVYALYLPLIIK